MKIVSNITKPIVLISKCTNIFRNLALEDFIYNSYNKIGFKDENCVTILWRNEPCVVIGRHQNIWAEANIKKCAEFNCRIARRRSGGGAVYHDLENINFTFFSNRDQYNRKQNLQCVSSILKDHFQIDCEVNFRDDLILKGNMKISGSAAKLGNKIAYHHFTLLINSDLNKITTVLNPFSENLISGRATASTRSTVTNLSLSNPSMETSQVLDTLALELSKQKNAELLTSNLESNQQLDHLELELSNWNWVYGHSPKFQIQRILKSNNSLPWSQELIITMEIESGMISDFKYEGTILNNLFCKEISNFSNAIRGCRFFVDDIDLRVKVYCANIDDIKIREWIHYVGRYIVNATL